MADEATRNEHEQHDAQKAQEVQEAQQELSPDDLRKELERARKEAAKYRTRLREQEEAAKRAEEERKKAQMSEAERYKAEKEEAERKAQEAEAKALRAERKASLAGKVADPEAALRLLDEAAHLDEDGNVSVEALLKSYPFLAPRTTGRAPTNGADPAGAGGKAAKLSELQERLNNARNRQERVRITSEIHALQRSK